VETSQENGEKAASVKKRPTHFIPLIGDIPPDGETMNKGAFSHSYSWGMWKGRTGKKRASLYPKEKKSIARSLRVRGYP